MNQGAALAGTPHPRADLVVIGAGIMGLFTAYHATQAGATVTILDAGRVGDPATASFGRTRSVRRDYLDPVYVRYADEALRLWRDFEDTTGARALVRCGMLNIAKSTVTPDLRSTYCQHAYELLQDLGFPAQLLDRSQLRQRLPQLDADIGQLDEDGGVADLAQITNALRSALAQADARLLENVDIASVRSDSRGVEMRTSSGSITGASLVITAGHGTNDVLSRVEGCDLHVPIVRDRPAEAKYFWPADGQRARYTSDVLPVIAYLDVGIYLHPIVDGVTDAVKIGFYNPPDVPRIASSISCVDDFVNQCLPDLAEATSEPVTVVDQCDYDLIADDDFVLGPVPPTPNVFVGVGWRGTGYKFAPWVGLALSQLAMDGASDYDLSRFQPDRFLYPAQAALLPGRLP